MSRRRRNSPFGPFISIIVLLCLFFSSRILDFVNSYSAQEWTLIIILLFTIATSGIVLIILWKKHQKQRMKLIWKRAMANWEQSQQGDQVIKYQSARYLSPGHLEKFAVQLFAQMGYRAIHTGRSGDHGVDVHLTNPVGQVELVQCKQWNKPVGEPEVRNLAGAMVHENAIRGFILAPNGFTQAAKSWAKGKNIVLADEREIGRLVESAYNPKTNKQK